MDQLAVCPPGEHILESMDERNWDVGRLAEALGLCRHDAEELLGGRMRVGTELAGKLADVIGGTAVYWLNLQDLYDDAAA